MLTDEQAQELVDTIAAIREAHAPEIPTNAEVARELPAHLVQPFWVFVLAKARKAAGR